jgi:hypothetical protein
MIPSENPDRFQISALSLWLIFFLVLLAVNSRCLFHPPYWDGVTGVFFQGQWLRTNSFDFGALAQQAGFAEGGPRIYAYNAVAPAYAFALSILPPSTVNLLAHVLVIAFSAATLTLFASILRRYCPTPDTLLWTSVVALNPMFSGQTAAIYLEIPLAFTFLLVIEALSTNRLALAVLVCALSFTIKPTALLLAASIAAWSVFSALIGHPLAKNRRFVDWCLFFAPLTAGFLLFGEFAVGASTQRLPLSEKFNSLLWTAGNGLILDVIPLALGLLVGAIVVSSAVKRERLNQDQQGLALLSLCAITSWGFWASLIVVSYPLCRYVVVVTAPSLLLLALGLKELFAGSSR